LLDGDRSLACQVVEQLNLKRLPLPWLQAVMGN
jgi:hypothetical protein